MGLLVRFFGLTYAVTWVFWLTAAAIARGAEPDGPAQPGIWTLFLYLGTFTPAFVALSMTARADGKTGVRALLARLFQGQVGVRWYLFASGFMAAVKLAAAVIHRVAMGEWPAFGQESLLLMMAATLFSVLVGGQTGEEIGWRGYALPRLTARIGLAPASVLLGAVWATWHLPLFFIFPYADTYGQSFPLYFLQVTAISVVIAWLWWRTGGSLLLTMLLHSAANNTKDIVPSAVPGATDMWALSTSRVAWITVALLWICAGYFLYQMPKRETAPVTPHPSSS